MGTARDWTRCHPAGPQHEDLQVDWSAISASNAPPGPAPPPTCPRAGGRAAATPRPDGPIERTPPLAVCARGGARSAPGRRDPVEVSAAPVQAKSDRRPSTSAPRRR